MVQRSLEEASGREATARETLARLGSELQASKTACEDAEGQAEGLRQRLSQAETAAERREVRWWRGISLFVWQSFSDYLARRLRR
eukprot:scaffold338313_cov14-Prasinocladus_malaysianus.AAC.1